jgi:hypothetical protein
MNKYRFLYDWDYGSSFECIKCKNVFMCEQHPTVDGYRACPHCRTVWDGEFTKRHERYLIPRINKPEYPKLAIRSGEMKIATLGDGFFTRLLKKPKIYHRIYTWLPLAPRYWTNQKSISKTMWEYYQRDITYKAPYVCSVELIKMHDKTNFTVIASHKISEAEVKENIQKAMSKQAILTCSGALG